jgi:hypothetical protein
MRDYCIFWRHKHSATICCEYVQSTRMSFAIEQALEYIAEVEYLELEDIYICQVEVIE